MRVMVLSILLIALPFAGCFEPDVPVEPAADADPAPPPVEPARLDAITVLASRSTDPGDVVEYSTCGMGEGPPLAREAGALILAGTDHVRVTVDARASNGVRVGYDIDDGAITWLEVVLAGQQRAFTVPVEDSALETDRERWTFYYQPNLPDPATQECYTGGSLAMSVLIEAVPAES